MSSLSSAPSSEPSGAPLGEKRTIRLPWAPSAAPRIRRELVEDLVARGVTPANVVEVEVSDGGAVTVPRPAPPTTWGPGGRGLRIVRSLAHEWGVVDDPNGRTVWASLGGPSRRRSH